MCSTTCLDMYSLPVCNAITIFGILIAAVGIFVLCIVGFRKFSSSLYKERDKP